MTDPSPQTLVAALATAVLLLLLVSTVLLWQLLDEVREDGSPPAQADLPPELPPPSGSGKALTRALDRSLGRVNGPLAELTAQLESANLGAVPVLLGDLTRNTQALPGFADQLSELTGPRGPFTDLQATLGTLGGRLLPLQTIAASLTTLNSGIGRVDRSLGNAAGALAATGAVTSTPLPSSLQVPATWTACWRLALTASLAAGRVRASSGATGWRRSASTPATKASGATTNKLAASPPMS